MLINKPQVKSARSIPHPSHNPATAFLNCNCGALFGLNGTRISYFISNSFSLIFNQLKSATENKYIRNADIHRLKYMFSSARLSVHF